MKPVQLSQDVLNSLAAKPVVIRVVIDRKERSSRLRLSIRKKAQLRYRGRSGHYPTVEVFKLSPQGRRRSGQIFQPQSTKPR